MRQHSVAVVAVAEVATLAIGARQMAAATHMKQARRPEAAEMAGELRQHSVAVVAEAEVATLAIAARQAAVATQVTRAQRPVAAEMAGKAAIAANQYLQKKLPNLDSPHDLHTNTMDSTVVA